MTINGIESLVPVSAIVLRREIAEEEISCRFELYFTEIWFVAGVRENLSPKKRLTASYGHGWWRRGSEPFAIEQLVMWREAACRVAVEDRNSHVTGACQACSFIYIRWEEMALWTKYFQIWPSHQHPHRLRVFLHFLRLKIIYIQCVVVTVWSIGVLLL